MVGENLKKAQGWFDRAVKLEEEGKSANMLQKCMEKMVECEKAGIAAGESWD